MSIPSSRGRILVLRWRRRVCLLSIGRILRLMRYLGRVLIMLLLSVFMGICVRWLLVGAVCNLIDLLLNIFHSSFHLLSSFFEHIHD